MATWLTPFSSIWASPRSSPAGSCFSVSRAPARPARPLRPPCAAVPVRAVDGPAGPRLAGGTGAVVIRAVRVISYTESRAGGLYGDGAGRPALGELRLPQRGADVHQDLTLQGRRGYGPVRGERFRQRAPSHAYGRQPEARRLGWREDGEVWSLPQLDDGAVRIHGDFRRPRPVQGDGLPGFQIRERDRQRAGDQKGRGPVRSLEYRDEFLVGHCGGPDVEPAICCGQGEGRRWKDLPVWPPGEGRGCRHQPADHTQQRAEHSDHSESPHGDHLHFAGTAGGQTPGSYGRRYRAGNSCSAVRDGSLIPGGQVCQVMGARGSGV